MFLKQVEKTVTQGFQNLAKLQKKDGHWVFPLEADTTISSEYIILNHYLGELEITIEKKLADFIKKKQNPDGGWPLFYKGESNISTSTKAYFALKLSGISEKTNIMKKAKIFILSKGGASKCNVFTRTTLALFDETPWRSIPQMPIEIMLLPSWFPFHLNKISYWSRTVLVPLLIIMAMQPKAKNPRKIKIKELFKIPANQERNFMTNPKKSFLGFLFITLDTLLRISQPLFPELIRKKALGKAKKWILKRLNGTNGLGAIFPAMVNSLIALLALNKNKKDKDIRTIQRSIKKLLFFEKNKKDAFCQPCISPVWDTAFVIQGLLEEGSKKYKSKIIKGMKWLEQKEIKNIRGDWSEKRPKLKSGGWAFQYENPFYPDLDDTALVGMIFHRQDPKSKNTIIKRTAEWVAGMQSKNGGWGSFDADNTNYYLNHIPFADHGALLDPPTADVTARCISFLSQIGYKKNEAITKGINFLKQEQEQNGSWFGRWGTNYIYGTWSVLSSLNSAGVNMNENFIKKSVDWLNARQNNDGGWGEDGSSYWTERKDERRKSSTSQTSWAILGLMAANQTETKEVKKGVQYLLNSKNNNDSWEEKSFTAVGFPKVFYLRYDGYPKYFPLLALARYKNLSKSNSKKVLHGI